MKRSYRRALFFVALLVFIAITPVVILYALGYRTSWTSADPIPVGVLLIESEPSRARIFANEKYIGLSPHALSNLRADSVKLRVEKTGYTTWQKTLSVNPGRATEVRDIRLFPETKQSRLIASNARLVSVSPNRRLLAVIHDNNTLGIYDQAGEIVSAPQVIRHAPQQMLWSPNSDALLLSMAKVPEYWYVSVGQRQPPSMLPDLTGGKSVVWDPRIPGRLLYLDQANTLHAYNVLSQVQVVLIHNIVSFATSTSYIYGVGTGENTIVRYTLQGQATDSTYNLPDGKLTKLLITPQNNIAVLIDEDSVWVVQDDEKFSSIATDIATITWSPSGQVLLLATDTSMYVYNVNDKRTTLPLQQLILVQRLSRPIATPEWFAGSRHLLYQVDDEVWIVETDVRDHPIAYQVDTTNTGQAQAAVGEEGEVMFYLKREGSQTNVVSTSLIIQ